MSESGRRPTEAMLRIAALKRFLYDPSTGVFTYKVRTRASSEGAIAGSRAVGGYFSSIGEAAAARAAAKAKFHIAGAVC
jgi:hypothetical protein